MKNIILPIGLGLAMAFALTLGSSNAAANAQDASCLMECAAKALACQEKAGEDVSKMASCLAAQIKCQEGC